MIVKPLLNLPALVNVSVKPIAKAAATLILTESSKVTDSDSYPAKHINKVLKSVGFKGSLGSSRIIPSEKGDHLYVVFGAKAAKDDVLNHEETLRKLGGAVTTTLNGHEISSANLIANDKIIKQPSHMENFLTGLQVRMYSFSYKKGDIDKASPFAKLGGIGEHKISGQKVADRVRNLVEGSFLTRRAVDEPSQLFRSNGDVEGLHSHSFVDLIGSVVKQHKKNKSPVAVKVYDKDQLKKMGAGSLLAVGAGSENVHPPYMVEVDYNGGNKKDAPYIFVCKAIMFDTGGLCIKPAAFMTPMKADMGGGATGLGLLHILCLQKAKVNVKVIFCIAENDISASAVRPSDIIVAMDGTTIENGHTDAEGRLALYDGICWAQKQVEKPKAIITIATLTGAVGFAYGRLHAAVFSEDDWLASLLLKGADISGDGLWRNRFDVRLSKTVRGDFTDLSNTSGQPSCGHETAALFLRYGIKEGISFAHIDLSNMAKGAPDVSGLEPKNDRYSSGYGPRMLYAALE